MNQNFFKICFPQCEYRAIHEGNLACYIQQVHDRAKYKCNQCKYRAATQINLIHHIQLVLEVAKYDFQCEYKATHKGNLACHTQSVYEGAKYECRQSDHGTTCKDNFTRHIKSTH